MAVHFRGAVICSWKNQASFLNAGDSGDSGDSGEEAGVCMAGTGVFQAKSPLSCLALGGPKEGVRARAESSRKPPSPSKHPPSLPTHSRPCTQLTSPVREHGVLQLLPETPLGASPRTQGIERERLPSLIADLGSSRGLLALLPRPVSPRQPHVKDAGAASQANGRQVFCAKQMAEKSGGL